MYSNNKKWRYKLLSLYFQEIINFSKTKIPVLLRKTGIFNLFF